MKKMIHMFLILLLIFSCKQEPKFTNNNFGSKSVSDTIVINDKTDKVIFIKPTIKYLDSIKNTYKNQDDFYTIADDSNFYTAEAGNFLKENKMDTINVYNNKILKIGNSIIKLSEYKPWSLLLYKKNKNIINVFPIDIEKEFNNYFLKKDNALSSINDIFLKYNINSSNILNKNEEDFDSNGTKDYMLIIQNSNGTRSLLQIENENNSYSLLFKNDHVILCEDCGNGAESFYDYNVDKSILVFSSSFKSDEEIYKTDFEFKNEGNGSFSLNSVSVFISEIGKSEENKITLSENNFGTISLKDFNYSKFLSKYILKNR